MFTTALEKVLVDASREAVSRHHAHLTLEHLLLALLDNPAAAEVLRACGADIETLRHDIASFLEETTPLILDDDNRETQPTLGFQRVLQRAVFHVQSSGKKEVTGANVLVAIFGEQESHAVFLLKQQDVSRLDVVNFISHGISKVAEDPPDAPPGAEPEEESSAPAGTRCFSKSSFARSWTRDGSLEMRRGIGASRRKLGLPWMSFPQRFNRR